MATTLRAFPRLRTLVAQAELNKNVELEIVRDGKPMKVTTQIKEQPIDYQTAGTLPQPVQPPNRVNQHNRSRNQTAKEQRSLARFTWAI